MLLVFQNNPCPHPIIFMRDCEVSHVRALLQFMYVGQVNIAQAQLSAFLRTADALQIRGLTDCSQHNDKVCRGTLQLMLRYIIHVYAELIRVLSSCRK